MKVRNILIYSLYIDVHLKWQKSKMTRLKNNILYSAYQYMRKCAAMKTWKWQGSNTTEPENQTNFKGDKTKK